MTQSYLNLRFEQIEKRLKEIETLILLSASYHTQPEIYQALCRSAHVLLVSHFEGLYKEICRDIIDDINANTKNYEVKRSIFNSFCDYFIHVNESDRSSNEIKKKLAEAFYDSPSKLKVDPFLYVDNKNPTPQIIESILEKFGKKNFFWSIHESDLDLVFKDEKTETEKLRERLLKYVKKGTFFYPYSVDTSFYRPTFTEKKKGVTTLWEDFLNNFLKERHNIVHGHILDNPNGHDSLLKAKVKFEILIYAFIINISSVANPIFFL